MLGALKHSRVPFAIHPILKTLNANIPKRLHVQSRLRHLSSKPASKDNHHHHVVAATSSSSPSIPQFNPPQSDEADAPHIPVLLPEILGFFDDRNIQVYVDGTLGAGGHASAILQQNPQLHTIVGFDMDPTAHALASARLQQHGAHIIPLSIEKKTGTLNINSPAPSPAAMTSPIAYVVSSNFSSISPVLHQLSFPASSLSISKTNDMSISAIESPNTTIKKPLYGHVDAALLDLGVSSMQIDSDERGFSFLRNGPLDMRMDPGALLSAEEIINTWPEATLGEIIREFGEERHWKLIASRIAMFREESPITTTSRLVKAIGQPGGASTKNASRDGKKMNTNKKNDTKNKHPATRTFQALRIAVNGELQSIAAAVPAAIDALAPGGRLAVITFHSLEDRIVKWAFRKAAGMSMSDEPLPWYCNPDQKDLKMSGLGMHVKSMGEQRGVGRGRAMLIDGDGSDSNSACVKILTKKPVLPSEEEIRMNSRSRSAKLRVVEKL